MKKSGAFYFLFLLFSASSLLSQENDTRYVKTPTGYLMVLKPGDQVIQQLEQLAEKEQIPSASFSGMGFAEVEFGFFDAKKKNYRPKHFEAAELASLQGSMAWQNGKPSLHAHGVITDKKFRAHGGHILSAAVGKGTLEIVIIVHDKKLERKEDESLGANVLCLDHCK